MAETPLPPSIYRVHLSDGDSQDIKADFPTINAGGDLMFWDYWVEGKGRGRDEEMVASFSSSIWNSFSTIEAGAPAGKENTPKVPPTPSEEGAIKEGLHPDTGLYFFTKPYYVYRWHFHWRFWRRKRCVGGPIWMGWWAVVMNKVEVEKVKWEKEGGVLVMQMVEMTARQVRIKSEIGLIDLKYEG
jgi:hypothetical protein